MTDHQQIDHQQTAHQQTDHSETNHRPTDGSTPIVHLDHVSFTYPGSDSESGPGTPVLSGVSLNVTAGETLAVVGPSGCGKSTLLNVIGGLLAPTDGSVLVAGRDPYTLSARDLSTFRNRTLGFVFQSHHLLPQCTAIENVLVPTLAQKTKNAAEATERARGLLDLVGLADRASHTPAKLSGGERQRVAVARALINEPTLLLADEPTGALDADNADRLAGILSDVNAKQGVTLITVTHSERLASVMGRRVTLHRGAVMADAEPASSQRSAPGAMP
ncbi:MAG: ABC transporter ATP-binding protein [Planctomycetota bacterium]